MRINKYLAQYSGVSRRAADKLLEEGRVRVNNDLATLGYQTVPGDIVTVDNNIVTPSDATETIMLNKPPGFVCSRDGQSSKTIYDILPEHYRSLKSIGRLDKMSSGLLLLTTDGQLAYELTHPSFRKTKIYKIALNKPLVPLHRQMIQEHGIVLSDGVSRLHMEHINDTDDFNWKVIMHEGRNRQIRRTFKALGYNVVKLHRTQFGTYTLNGLALGKYKII
ncbi:MAG: pseudouridine synthase [Candidatus Saccharimonadales bacterium]